MKHPRLRFVLLAGLFAIPALAHAHPGHDGDHELVWDLDHFVSHPLATLMCVAVVATAGWLVWRLLRSRRPEGSKSPASERR
jgi:hypothetical protein